MIYLLSVSLIKANFRDIRLALPGTELSLCSVALSDDCVNYGSGEIANIRYTFRFIEKSMLMVKCLLFFFFFSPDLIRIAYFVLRMYSKKHIGIKAEGLFASTPVFLLGVVCLLDSWLTGKLSGSNGSSTNFWLHMICTTLSDNIHFPGYFLLK